LRGQPIRGRCSGWNHRQAASCAWVHSLFINKNGRVPHRVVGRNPGGVGFRALVVRTAGVS
jgi:hypothetical protein